MVRFPWLPKIEAFFWGLFLVTLPVTSFPFFPSGLGGSTLVRPFSVYPLLVLMVIAVLPRLVKGPVSRTLLPFFAFVLAAVGSTLLAFLRDIDPLLGVSVPDRAIRTLVTLFLGGGFYLAVALIPDTLDKLRASLRWLYAGFGVALMWGSFQAVYVLWFRPDYFNLLKQMQRLVSIRKLFPTRISGMTYEPNWFAEQIAFLLMPLLFSAVFSGYSAFRWRARWRWLSVELILLVWPGGVLLFTFSRSGMILLAVQLILVLLFRPGTKQNQVRSDQSTRWKLAGKRILQASLALVVLVGLLIAVGSRNNYFARLWNYWTDEESTGQYLQYIAFDQRFTYWGTALRMYEAYPVMGMATFLAFLVALMGCACYLVLAQGADHQFWGRAGMLGLLVFLVISFSFDSFSLPNMWVVFGFITASAQIRSDGRV